MAALTPGSESPTQVAVSQVDVHLDADSNLPGADADAEGGADAVPDDD